MGILGLDKEQEEALVFISNISKAPDEVIIDLFGKLGVDRLKENITNLENIRSVMLEHPYQEFILNTMFNVYSDDLIRLCRVCTKLLLDMTGEDNL